MAGGGFNMDINFGAGPGGKTPRDPQTPMRILIMGDFSGRGVGADPAGAPPIANRPIRALDVDTLDSLVQEIGPAAPVTLPSGDTLHIGATEFDDFHPDALWRNVPIFSAIRELRASLKDPKTFAEAARQLGMDPSAKPSGGPGARQDAEPQQGGSSLADLLGGEVKQPGVASAADAIIKNLLGGSPTAPKADPRLAECLDALHRAAGVTMRAILESPGFRAIETAWRAAHMLCTTIETDEETLHLRILDMPLDELRADLAQPDPQTARRLKREIDSADGGPLTMLVGLYTLDVSEPDATFARDFALLGSSISAPVICAATPALAGCPDIATTPDIADWSPGPLGMGAGAWGELRSQNAAPWLGLAAPRLLLRQPYGATTDPIDAFPFEEIPAEDLGTPRAGDRYLWAPGSVAVACALAQAYSIAGWSFNASAMGELAGVPMHSYTDASGSRAAHSPCEAWYGDKTRDRISQAGLIALSPIQGRDAVRVGPIRSYAGGALAGLG